jgi:predicted O-methyltransferase YrrM
VYRERPKIHLSKTNPTCWRIKPETAQFIYNNATEFSSTLETGAGLSTLIFAMRKCSHIAITPSKDEIEAIKEYAKSKSISLDSVTFANESSESYLPRANLEELEMVLIDGQHAFPWPIIDWFYTAGSIKKGGILILDDIQIPSVNLLRSFLADEKNWKALEGCSSNAVAYRKLNDDPLNVNFYEQRYNIKRMRRKEILMNPIRKLRHLTA